MDISNEKLLVGARNLKNKGYSKEQVDAWLQSKGSSLNDMRAFAKSLNETSQQEVSQEPRPELKPLTEDQKAKSGRSWLDTANNFIDDFKSGFSEGAQYGAERIANGATLGLYDKANSMLGGDAKERAQRVEGYDDAAGRGNSLLNSKNVGTALDFIGGLVPTAKIYQGASKIAKPVMAMALATGTEQGIRNAIDSRSLKDAGMKGAIGFAEGLTEGGTLGAGFKLAKGAYYLTKGSTQRGLNYLKKEIGEDALNQLVDKAKEQGRTLVEVINDKLGGTLDDVIGNVQGMKEKANNYIKSKVPQMKQNARDKVNRFIDDFFGEVNGFDNVETIKKAVDTEAKPAWEYIYSQGDVSLKSPELAKMIKEDKALRKIIKDVRNDPYLPKELQNVSDGNIGILERARQDIVEKVSDAIRTGKAKHVKDDLLALQDRFLSKVKAATQGYSETLEKYGDFHKIDDATRKAASFFKDSNPKQFAKEYAKLGEAERDAYKLGIKDELEKMVGKKSEKAAWETITSPNNKAKIKTVFGEEDGGKLIKFAEEEAKRVQRFKNIENANKAEPKDPKGFWYNRLANQALDLARRASLKEKKTQAMGIAELLTNAEKLQKSIKNNSEYLPVKLDKALQKYLGKDYLPVSAIQGAIEYNRNNKF